MLLKHEELWLAWSKKMTASVARLVLTCSILLTLRRFCHDVITALMYDDSSTSFRADSSDEDLVDEIFVNSMFPDYNHDYPRTNIEDLNESQCDAKSKHFV